MLQVIDRAGRRGEVQHVVDRLVIIDVVRDVMTPELETRVRTQMLDVAERAGDEVVNADYLMAHRQETLAQM